MATIVITAFEGQASLLKVAVAEKVIKVREPVDSNCGMSAATELVDAALVLPGVSQEMLWGHPKAAGLEDDASL